MLKNLLCTLLLVFSFTCHATEEFRLKKQSDLPLQVLLLNDTSAWYHWGCTGTSTQLKISIIRDCGFFLSSLPIQANYGIVDFPLTAAKFNSPSHFEAFRFANPKLVEMIERSDIVVINGEGTLHGIRPGPLRLLYLAHISKRFLNKHVEIINHSVFPQDSLELTPSDEAAKIYQMVYQDLDFVAVRDAESARLLQQMHIPATRSFDCLPLYIQENYKKGKKSPQKTLLISGSVAWEETGMPAFIQYLDVMRERGYTIRFLTGARQNPALDDERLIAFLKNHCPQGCSVVQAASLEHWLKEIEQATLLVSGRFHHSIAAACLNTPFICLNSNTPKIQALATDIPFLETLSYSDPQLHSKLLEQTDTLLKKPPSDNALLLEKLCRLAKQNFNGLKSITAL